MKLHYFRSRHGNFGDDLNGWIWPELLPGLWDEGEDGVTFVGISTTVGGGFPHGFEVQIVGPSSARQVLLHLTAVSTRRKGFWAWSDLQVSVDTRDI